MDFTTLSVVQLAVFVAVVVSQPLTMTILPDAVRPPLSDVIITCSVDRVRTTNHIVWTRCVGAKLCMQIGMDNFKHSQFEDSDSRYRLSVSRQKTTDTYTLNIMGLSVTDTATIGCKLKDAVTNLVNRTLVVCDHPNSTSCECLVKSGYLTPACFEEPPSVQSVRDSYDKKVHGLTACLVIVIVFGIGMSVLAGRDCIKALNVKRKRKMEELHANRDAARANGDTQALSRDTESEISDVVSPSADRIIADRPTNQYAHMLSTQTHQNPAFAADEPSERSRYEEIGNGREYEDANRSRMPMEPPTYSSVSESSPVIAGARRKTNGYANKPSPGYANKPSPLVLDPRTAGVTHAETYSPSKPRNQNDSPYQRAYSDSPAKSSGNDPHTYRDHPPHSAPQRDYSPRNPQESLHPGSSYPPRLRDEATSRGYTGAARNEYTDPPRERIASDQRRGQDAQPKWLDIVHGRGQLGNDDDDSGPYVVQKDVIV